MKLLFLASLAATCVQAGPLDDLADSIKDAATGIFEKVESAISSGDVTRFSAEDVGKITNAELTNLKESKLLEQLSQTQFGSVRASWVADNFADLDEKEINLVTAEQIESVSADVARKLTTAQWNTLDMSKIEKWAKDVIAEIPVEDFVEGQLSQIPVDRITDLTLEQIKSIKWDQIGEMTNSQWDKLPMDKLGEMGWEQLQQAPLERWEKVSIDAIKNLPVDKLFRLTGEQIAKIKPEVLGEAGQKFWDDVPIYQLAHLTTAQLTKLGVENLDEDKLAKLTDDQWENMPVKELVGLGAKGLKAVNLNTLANLEQDGWDMIPFDSIPTGIAGKKIQSIPPANVGKWTKENWKQIPVKELMMFSGEQLNNKATLAKLSIDALAQYARSGNLDTDKLSADVKKQLDKRMEEVGTHMKDGLGLVKNIADYEILKADTEKASVKLAALKNEVSTPKAKIDDAQKELEEAKSEEYATALMLVSAGYLDAGELGSGGGDNSPASRAAPVLACVAMAIALVAM